MKEYQPWNEDWRKEITFLPWLPPHCEDMEGYSSLPMYPIFVNSLKKKPEEEELKQGIVGAMIYILGHEPDNPLTQTYSEWLNLYNPSLATQALADGTFAASLLDLPTAIWMLQAALLLDPELTEGNFNLGLAFCQLGESLQSQNKLAEAKSSYQQAYQYLKNALELDKELSLAYYTLGVTCRRLGLQEESRVNLEKAITLDLSKNKNQFIKEEGYHNARNDSGLYR